MVKESKRTEAPVQYPVLNVEGKEVGSIGLDGSVFAAPVLPELVHAVVRWQLAKRRAGTHQALTRSMMKGGGKKPFKQKGTGRARAGSIISPLWVGGASIHGPLPRSYEHRISKRVRGQALAAVLSEKISQKKLFVVDDFGSVSGKTKEMVAALAKIGACGKTSSADRIVMLIPARSGGKRSMVERASSNIPQVVGLSIDGVNVYDLLRCPFIVGSKDLVLALQERVKHSATGR